MFRRFHLMPAHLAPLAAGARGLSMGTIINTVKSKNLFDPKLVDTTTKYYLDNFSNTTYSNHFSDADIAMHIQGVLTAEARQRIGDSFVYVHETPSDVFYLCGNSPAQRVEMVRRVASFVSRTDGPKDHGTVTRSYVSADRKMAIFYASYEKYVNPNPPQGECSLDVVGTDAYLRSLDPEVRKIHQKVMDRVTKSVYPVYEIFEKDGALNFTMASFTERTNHIASLLSVFHEIKGIEVFRSTSYTFSNHINIYSFQMVGVTPEQIQERASFVGLIPNRPSTALTRMHQEGQLTVEEAVYLDSALIFSSYFTTLPKSDDYVHLMTIVAKEANGANRLNNLRRELSQEVVSERYTSWMLSLYPEFGKALYKDFKKGSTAESRAAILSEIEKRLRDDQRPPFDLSIFKGILKFNAMVLKHNFYKTDKAALCYRMSPEFMRESDFSVIPYAVFLFVGSQWRGFHIRFTDISRGGVRMIISKPNTYAKNKRSVFQENYNLAFTQNLKNKDIPEGGAKGTILVASRYLTQFAPVRCRHIFLQYVDSMMDCILPAEKGVVDNLKKEEIIFLGPDENTAGTFPAAGALYSKARGFKSWKSFTTGKDASLGGIPHDEYGMTTHSVRAYVEGVYSKLGLDGSKLKKFQTGGPDGDLGSNEIKRSTEIYIGLVDISASLHDPNGLNKEELLRLATERLPLRHFNKSKLSKDGFLVLTEEKNVKLPDGTVVEDGARFRDEFHFLPYSNGDVFVPCGGRPRSVTLDNVGRFLRIPDADGEGMLAGKFEKIPKEQLKFKYIIEGANLFITQDARVALERCGVVLFKDASTNKGGVTSSSLEVYAGLCLSDEEHAKHMCVHKGQPVPEFYKKYVEEIKDRIQENARLEFNAIWAESLKDPKTPRIYIADRLSQKNVNMRANMLNSDLFENKQLVRYILKEYTPKTILELVDIDTIMQRVPVGYQHAICAMSLVSKYVYSSGLHANEFDFFKYMNMMANNAQAQSKV
uniref:Glutamate dehydrogenase n=1 Tax=Angomonas desouzai TaxID=59800 RepID=U5KLE5_9TRYP|nr:glutamate dehydrogenase [Angomonas desouzai]